jgi:hypothetical protein
MKKHFITLIVAASAVLHAQAADLASQLQGYWQPDMEKTAALAKKGDREMDPMTQAMMGRMVFEFQIDKMTVHPPAGMKSDATPQAYKVTAVDKAKNSLALSIDGKEGKVRFDKEQMAMFEEEGGWMVFNRMSKEDFAKREPVGDEIFEEGGDDEAPAAGELEDVSSKPIPDKPAVGKIGGKEFKVEKATLEDGNLKLRKGEGFFADMEFKIFLFGQDGKFDGRKITVKPKEDSTTAHIHMSHKEEGKDLPETEIITEDYTMKLEFGTAKDGKIPAKIHLRLPDEAGSFVVGTFEAELK